ncbi:nitrilase-related carbon-nitrogen hydrolase [Polymorphum gilvum]|uniref:Nitrilase/cyanide hydratase and apolipoprotein N-acyltransferase n=1 Tax=Polymorphum gilvum (strain LMG 25793 / CGMCC 1.9160 / SL003B-26A1) TaxID=991905 RepID=F2J4D7_POLGS|nr:nitrilase-related carbon-nitrogen hydrolase [Polymorphum gilvum]ADZ71079.1 Nitrilase/cyanide hydratase and apolipoprotein N-acyltransferase [Polymorphum gilvum SL003B-26A1]
MTDFPIALWSMNLGFAPASPEAFVARVEARMAEAAQAGARLLMLPEYAVESCLAFKPAGLPETGEIAFLAGVAETLVPALAALPAKHGLSLLAGSMPWRVEAGGRAGFVNRAFLFAADGRTLVHDKLSLTPAEQDDDAWRLQPGSTLTVFELEGLRMAMLICLDVEMPALSCLLAKENLDLLLVPSMTEMRSGFHRVYDCAKARAVELMTTVAVCGCVGAAKGTTQNPTNVSGAALFTPCEPELDFDGRPVFLPPTGGEAGEEPFVVVRLPVDAVRALKAGGAEVWPGAWTADHVRVARV